MTMNEIVTIISSHFNRDLSNPFKLMMAERVNYWRSRLIRETLTRNGTIERKFFRQELTVAMKPEKETGCNIPIEVCDVAISIDDIPTIVRANNISFDFIGGIDGIIPFQEYFYGGINFFKNQRYVSKNYLGYIYSNKKIKVYGNPNIPFIKISAIFDDPLEIIRLACNYNCEEFEEEYPASLDIIQLIVQMILQVDYQRINAIPENRDIQIGNDNETNQTQNPEPSRN